LVELNISENNLTNLPNLSPIKTLEHLIINDNKIKGLPLLGEGLRKVEASSNSVSEIRASTFQNCSKLEILTLNKNGVERIEKGSFSQAKSMVVLELKENRLACFTEAPWSEKLDILALSFNRLT
jgi:Leucine-rich repeat (LRR) protein